MHEKFKEKLSRDFLLDEMEQASKEIAGILKTVNLLENYCSKNIKIKEIDNMTHLVETMRLQLYCLNKELEGIVKRQKYKRVFFLDNL